MATYDKCIYDIPPYQEGNLQDFEFDIDEDFPIADVDEITFQVRSQYDNSVIISRKMSDSVNPILLAGRTITVPILPADTLGYPGVHQYEIDLVNTNNQPFATIGGKFTINAEIDKL
jgi:hypothetical protein